MAGAGASGGQLLGERLFRAVSSPAPLVVASIVISASLMFLPGMFELRFLALMLLLFLAGAAAVLMGDAAKMFMYSIFLVQFSVSFVFPVSLYITVAFMVFFIPLLVLGGGTGKIGSVPFHRPMALLLAGWLVSLIYVAVFINSRHTYTQIYDVYLLLGFGVAYMIFVMLRLKYLDVERLLYYIAHSGLLFVGLVAALYVFKGYTGKIFNERFGTSVNINSNTMTMYIEMTLACSFLLAVSEWRSVMKKMLLYASAAVQAAAILMAGSRSGFITIAAIMAFYIWPRRSIKLYLISAAGVAVAYFTVGQRMMARIFNPTYIELISDYGRVELLRAAVNILRENMYMFGIGMNNFAAVKFDYGFPAWFDPSTNKGFSSHNLYLELWLGWGILGLAGWLLFNAGVIWALFRCRSEKHRGAAYAVAVALTVFLLHGTGDSSIANYSMMFTYFSLVGAALFMVTRKQDTLPH
jgi:O-antigen ligase